MTDKANKVRAGYGFRLGGLKTIAGFTVSPSLTSDRINRAWDERLRNNRGANQAQTGSHAAARMPDFQADCA